MSEEFWNRRWRNKQEIMTGIKRSKEYIGIFTLCYLFFLCFFPFEKAYMNQTLAILTLTATSVSVCLIIPIYIGIVNHFNDVYQNLRHVEYMKEVNNR